MSKEDETGRGAGVSTDKPKTLSKKEKEQLQEAAKNDLRKGLKKSIRGKKGFKFK